MGVSSWAFKHIPKSGAYPITALRGTAAEKRAQASLLKRLVQLIPQMRATLKATQGRYKRNHDKRLALRAGKRTVGGCAWLRDNAKEEGAGGKLTHVARGPYQGLSWIIPRGIHPYIKSVYTSDTSRGRVSIVHYEKRR